MADRLSQVAQQPKDPGGAGARRDDSELVAPDARDAVALARDARGLDATA